MKARQGRDPAPAYAEQRKVLAKQIVLGRKPGSNPSKANAVAEIA